MAVRKTSRAASKDVKRAMTKRKRGTLKSGSGRKVTSCKQAIDIGLSRALSAQQSRERAPKDMRGRTGFPGGVAAARGGAKDFTTPRDMRAGFAVVR